MTLTLMSRHIWLINCTLKNLFLVCLYLKMINTGISRSAFMKWNETKQLHFDDRQIVLNKEEEHGTLTWAQRWRDEIDLKSLKKSTAAETATCRRSSPDSTHCWLRLISCDTSYSGFSPCWPAPYYYQSRWCRHQSRSHSRWLICALPSRASWSPGCCRCLARRAPEVVASSSSEFEKHKPCSQLLTRLLLFLLLTLYCPRKSHSCAAYVLSFSFFWKELIWRESSC